jgi:hypothetical protein
MKKVTVISFDEYTLLSDLPEQQKQFILKFPEI